MLSQVLCSKDNLVSDPSLPRMYYYPQCHADCRTYLHTEVTPLLRKGLLELVQEIEQQRLDVSGSPSFASCHVDWA